MAVLRLHSCPRKKLHILSAVASVGLILIAFWFLTTNTGVRSVPHHLIYSQYDLICGGTKPTIFTSTTGICYSVNNSLLMIQMTKWTELDICALTLAAKHNPEFGVCVLQGPGVSVDEKLLEKLTSLQNVEIRSLEPQTLIAGAGLEAWYRIACFRAPPDLLPDRRFLLVEASDVFRLAYLFKYGGIYLDTDVLSLRPFRSLPQNSVGYEDGFNNHIMKFTKGNTFLLEVLQALGYYQRPDLWGSTGPFLLTHVYHQRILKGIPADSMTDITLMPRADFQSIDPSIHFERKLFKAKYYNEVMEKWKDSHFIHYLRASLFQSGHLTVEKESLISKICGFGRAIKIR